MRRLIFALSLFAATTGCDQKGIDPGREVYDGFETRRLSGIWSDDRFERGAVQMQTNVVRAGRSAVQITVRKGDIV